MKQPLIPPIAIYGAGRFGRALCGALRHVGVRVVALGIREGAKASKEQKSLRTPIREGAREFLAELEDRTLVFVCVQDRNIYKAATEIAACEGAKLHRYVHPCATKGPLALEALQQIGSQIGALHLLQSFGPSRYAWQRVAGSFAAIEAVGKLKRELWTVARAIGAMPIEIRGNQRAAYHAAAVLSSNAIVTLLDAGERILKNAGFDESLASKMLLPLSRGSLENVALLGAEQALTGPVVRGDAETVKAHLIALTRQDRELYRTLMSSALELAIRSKRLTEADAKALRQVLAG
ncbi:hypothetical protein PLCT2_01786 [Planctomycetaceae bacterium]|nr:hypothetical protein PLCT2_01786 [Planctomycetaceae bacterium]